MSAIGIAPWRPLFLSHLSKMDSPAFVLTTLQPSSSATCPYIPHARYCIFRGMFAELPENKHNSHPQNERVYESDLLTLTTDVRMNKVPDIFASSAGHGDGSQSQGSGGGGPAEALFWVKEVMTQWRFRGEAYVIGPDIEGAGKESSGTRTVKNKLGERMRLVREEGKEEWSWLRELNAHFANLSPVMRGSFKNPPPGTPKGVVPAEKELALGQKVTGSLEEDEVAKGNFRVIVIKVDEVEQLDLTEPEKARRWRFTYVAPDGAVSGRKGDHVGEWKKEELWP